MASKQQTKFQQVSHNKPTSSSVSIEKTKKKPLYTAKDTAATAALIKKATASVSPALLALPAKDVVVVSVKLNDNNNSSSVSSSRQDSAVPALTGLPPIVGLITPDAVEKATDVVCNAFATDPLFQYVLQPVGGPEGRPDLHRLFQSVYVAGSVKHGMAYQVEDCGSLALFFPPGTDVADSWADLLKMLAPVPLPALTRYLVDYVAPTELAKRTHLGIGTKAERRYYNLSVAATRPDKQGMGLLKHVLKPALARADAEGAVTWLESTKERNVPIYERFGFKTVETIYLKDKTPIFLMMREPQV
ncbi:hypothetical protein SmJEL517_g05532 [Synchytrium microbalum]|uniref:N-acetyltransferase domain-containing protein n=1 Tax=Synchytrium microbalum TaxID=1806994 RepID=A0A507BKM0_9FUNG|nr:uncharacterized protein SmJEL517_g05532 [Synchytrium microbalum]TPX31010.1 hypothetical protein SmJEL517_g05532 [Synchytrium microbalum]